MLYLSIVTVTRCGAGGGSPGVSSISDAQQTKAHIPTSLHMYVQCHAEFSESWVGSLPLAVDLRSQKEQGVRGLCSPVRCRGVRSMEKRL